MVERFVQTNAGIDITRSEGSSPVLQEFSVLDYFRKYGFRDGDDEGLMGNAEAFSDGVARMVTRGLRRFACGNIIDPKMECYDMGTAHNPIRAEIIWRDQNRVLYVWDADNGVMVDCGESGAATVHGRRQKAEGWVREGKNIPDWIEDVLLEVQMEVNGADPKR